MAFIFGGGKSKVVQAPPVPDPPPIPVVSDEAGDLAAKQERKKSGIAQTFLTGSLKPTSTGKKTTLG